MRVLPTTIKGSIFDMLTNQEANDLCDLITNWLSEKYGYYVNSYCYDIQIELTDIDWNTEKLLCD